MTYAVVDKNNKRVIAIVDSILESYFRTNFTVFSIIEIETVGSVNFLTERGVINAITVSERGNHFFCDDYYMIKRIPEGMDLNEAYEIINNK